MNIDGKTAIITGGASGLGRAAVMLLYNMGANVVIADLNTKTGSETAKQLGDRALFVQTDISVENDVKNVCKTALDKFGAIHLLVNAAGLGGSMRILGKNGIYDLNKFKNIVNINLVGTFSMICNAAWEMRNNKPEDGERGVIVNVASVAAFEGQIGQVAYSATKAGICGMTIVMAREFAREGIRVCTVAPGIMDTPMLAKIPEDSRKSLGEQVPFPSRMGKSEEFAQLTKSIIEIQYLNGEIIRLDGAIRMAPK